MKNKYPRFFILSDPELVEKYELWKEILYIRLDDPRIKYKHVFRNGHVSLGYSNERICDKTVDEGIWKEITIEEVALL